jgi:hypothetical protein
MQNYQFTAYGNKMEGQFKSGSDAMVQANEVLLWSNPKSKDGAWFQDGDSNSYFWGEGNYFD